MTQPLRLSVVCPFFNEEAIIEAATARMLSGLTAAFGDSDWELILVNDGSRDRSLAFVGEMLKSAAGSLRLLSLPRNQGRGRALKVGIDAARGDIIVTTEVDCSWGDDIVRRLYDVLEQHPEVDFVIASPHLPGGGLVNVAPKRVFLTKVGNLLIRTFFAPEITMSTGMTRAYRRHVIQPLVLLENGKEFHLEVLLKLRTLGFKAAEIPAVLTWQEHKLAREGSPKRQSSTRIAKTINSHLRFLAIAQPVRYFAWFSAVSLLTGLGFLGAAVVMLLTHGTAAYLALVGLLMLLFCLLFLGFSVLFGELRESLRDSWGRSYPGPQPLATPAAIEIDSLGSGNE
jgi:glycosyltransferase involved in cell wall biosynthesis